MKELDGILLAFLIIIITTHILPNLQSGKTIISIVLIAFVSIKVYRFIKEFKNKCNEINKEKKK